MKVKRAMGPRASDGRPRLTLALIGVNVFFFALAAAQGLEPASEALELLRPKGTVLFQLGVQYNPAVDAGQWWRIVTAIFLHLGIIHLLFNCYVLWITGQAVEEEFGGRLMFLIYIASGILGFVASYFADIGGAGASGAVSGLMGAVLVRRWLVDGDFSHPTTRYVLQLIVITVIFSIVVPNINHVAHAVGFAVGAGFAWLLTRVNLGRRGALALAVATVITGLGTIAAGASMCLALLDGGPDTYREAEACWREVQTVLICEHSRTAAVKDPSCRTYHAKKQVASARGCLAKMPSLESGANRARDDAKRAMERLEAALSPPNQPLIDEALNQLKAAFEAFILWRRDALPRYGFQAVM